MERRPDHAFELLRSVELLQQIERHYVRIMVAILEALQADAIEEGDLLEERMIRARQIMEEHIEGMNGAVRIMENFNLYLLERALGRR